MKKFTSKLSAILQRKGVIIAIVILVYLLARIGTWLMPADNDHWLFYYVGKIWIEGGDLYIDAWDHKPPLIYLFNGILHLAFDNNIFLHRIFFTLLGFINILLFYKVLRFFIEKYETLKRRIAVLFGMVFFVFWTNLAHFTAGGNNTENFALTFLLAGILSYLGFVQSKNKNMLLLIITGIFLSFLPFLKPNLLLVIAIVPIDLLIRNWSKEKFSSILKIIVFGIPFLIHAGIWFYYFNSQGTVSEFLDASLFFNGRYLRSGWLGQVSGQIKFLIISSPLFFSIAYFVLNRLFKIKKEWKDPDKMFVLIWSLIGILFFAMLGTFYPYYYLPIIPAFAILVATTIPVIKKNTVFILFMIAALMGVGFSLAFSMLQALNSYKGENALINEEYKEIAQYIKEKTISSEKIIAYDYGSTFYALSERDSASRYVSASHPLLDYQSEFGYGINDIYIQDILDNYPVYIIYPKSESSVYKKNKPVVDFFEENYVIDQEFDYYYLLVPKDKEE